MDKHAPSIALRLFQLVGLVVLALVGIRVFIVEGRVVGSETMDPTLQANERVLVNKVGYKFQRPQRGDLVVFQAPAEARRASASPIKQPFLQRIVGLPEETIEIRDGKVFIDSQALVEPYIAEPMDYTWGPSKVPKRQYVVLGDNRNNSSDSHIWGFLPQENIIGKVITQGP